MKKQQVHKFRTGIELIYGRPGSGKSYMAVKRVVDDAMEFRRPVFTNLPLRWRVVRKYLQNRGGSEIAGLFHPLTEAHFLEFLKRFKARQRFDEQHKDTIPRRADRVAAWLDHAGPDVIAGPAANWIPAGAIVCIDEAHHWFPNPAIVKGAKEPEGLLSYLTMHRHMLHEVIAITQADRQISQSWKSLHQRRWLVHPRADDRIAWNIRFKHLGIGGLGYLCFAQEHDEKFDQPIESFTTYPSLPWNQWVFRLYTSFTHQGSARELQRSLSAVRVADGLEADGSVKAAEAADTPPESESAVMWLLKTFVAAAVLVFAVAFGAAVSARATTPTDELASRVAALEVSEPSSPTASGAAPDAWIPPAVQSLSGGFIRVDGVRHAIPGPVQNGYVAEVDLSSGRVLWVGPGGGLWESSPRGGRRKILDPSDAPRFIETARRVLAERRAAEPGGADPIAGIWPDRALTPPSDVLGFGPSVDAGSR